MGERVLIALGGNAMTAPDGSASPDDQRRAVERAMTHVATLIGAGHQVVLTHGNGPQVGNLLLKNQIAAEVVPPVPLDWCGAQTQATIGVLILNALGHPAAVVVTRTLVDLGDPAFADPVKPIGRYFSEAEARRFERLGQTWRAFPGRGFRRVVASPEPLEIIDASAALALMDAGYTVVVAGGGGVPVARLADGSLTGVEAVVDKDAAAAVLASAVRASVLVVATDVPAAVLGYGTELARPIGRVTVAELRAMQADGHFARGSMGPKVEAALRFAEGGGRAVITSLEHIGAALAGEIGTAVGW
ncbi:carbamate kinase [Sphaerisporangium melleum]|uniref:Carbamate kinase n=1 Tax=Sphaerisporangium melleum TaxID=321316 RepID=A0A917QTF1_9ACTN|nr:carbamate kinase [Sphaerisporangium melleum]GGK67735.1 carbamate kinase [Sphaerisporangium melleum]GII68442.1 carbamate kinase [Sphaerisporangium melleum]